MTTPSAPPEENPHYNPSIVPPPSNNEIPVVSAIPVTSVTTGYAAEPAGSAPSYQTMKPTNPTPVTGTAEQGLGGTTTVTTTVETTEYEIPDLGRTSVEMQCPFCGHKGKTKVDHEFSAGSFLWMIVFFFLFWPAMCCVCCCKELQDTNHRCKNCGRIVGKTRTFAECFS